MKANRAWKCKLIIITRLFVPTGSSLRWLFLGGGGNSSFFDWNMFEHHAIFECSKVAEAVGVGCKRRCAKETQKRAGFSLFIKLKCFEFVSLTSYMPWQIITACYLSLPFSKLKALLLISSGLWPFGLFLWFDIVAGESSPNCFS